jgi:hypothetical protein
VTSARTAQWNAPFDDTNETVGSLKRKHVLDSEIYNDYSRK